MKKTLLFLCAALPFFVNAQFSEPQSLSLVVEPRFFWDVDLDGDLDFLDHAQGTWAERDESGNYFQTWQITFGQLSGFADIDNDGDPDGYGYEIESGLFGWFENEGTHDIWPYHGVANFAYGVVFDLNMDGLLDITSLSESDQDNAYYNLGNGEFSDAQPLIYETLNGLLNGTPVVCDLDNDGFKTSFEMLVRIPKMVALMVTTPNIT